MSIEHGHGSSHGGHCRCVKGCQVHTLLFFQQQPYFQIGWTLFSGLQHFPLTHNAWPLTAVHRDCCALSHPLGRRHILLFAHHRSCHQKGFSSTLFFGFSWSKFRSDWLCQWARSALSAGHVLWFMSLLLFHVIVNCQLLPHHSGLYWPRTQLYHLVTHSWANWILVSLLFLHVFAFFCYTYVWTYQS